MPKYFFKRVLPDYQTLQHRKALKPFQRFFQHAAIWRVNRKSISVAVGIGVFSGAFPLSIQTWIAALIAILWGKNLPTAMICTLWSNPLTMPPIFYGNYLLGSFLLGIHAQWPEHLSLNWDMFSTLGSTILIPLFFGSFVVGIVGGIAAYFAVQLWWRLYLQWYLHKRHQRKYSRHTS